MDEHDAIDVARIKNGIEQFAATMNAVGAAFERAMADFVAKWPPERVIASVIEEHNRRMAEFHGR